MATKTCNPQCNSVSQFGNRDILRGTYVDHKTDYGFGAWIIVMDL